MTWGRVMFSMLTEKPAELFRQMIVQSTNIGDKVLDCFGGGGAI